MNAGLREADASENTIETTRSLWAFAMPPDVMLHDFAPAKVNLFLHVLGRQEDGYHRLESLVGFADVGDALTLTPGEALTLFVDGPMAQGLAEESDNLVLRAARLFAETFPEAQTGRFRLTKNLPVASGIGGGSSDAAAVLRLLCGINQKSVSDPRVMAVARALGADVPVCLEAKPRLMRGIGHELGPVLTYVDQSAVLINPGVSVETKAVFAALKLKPGERYVPAGLVEVPVSGQDALLRLETTSGNHLESAAMALTSKIGRVLTALRAEPGCRFARMSGSGATCFGLFENDAAAKNAAASIKAIHYRWWVQPCRIQLPL